ncbi:MAG: YicC family protein [Lachnospiraceae bacterium]|nr:YicC family protein [Lachnospiraceae bacterium]
MIKSMTGFGRCEIVNEDAKITVEMKAVNHRYLDLGIKMPRRFNVYESAIRAKIKELGVERGKVDVFINCEDYKEEQGTLKFNAALAQEYVSVFQRMQEELGVENDLRASTLARMPEVLTIEQEEDDEEELWQMLQDGICGAVENFNQTRIKEGENLKRDLIGKLDQMEEVVNQIESRSPGVMQEYRERITAKVTEFLENTSVDDSRIAAEVTLFADKVCTDEETVRLHSHIHMMKDNLLSGGSLGRKLDFLAQEMNREANTILSKANDLQVSELGISLKTEIEKVREQIQNIE